MSAMAAAKLIGWGARVLYLGPAFGLTPHRNATAVLAVVSTGRWKSPTIRPTARRITALPAAC